MLSLLFRPDGGLFRHHEPDRGGDSGRAGGGLSFSFSRDPGCPGACMGGLSFSGKNAVRQAGASDLAGNPAGCDGEADAAELWIFHGAGIRRLSEPAQR